MKLSEIIAVLDDIAPPSLAESWDNVGLLVGDPAQSVTRCLLTIDYTPAVADEAKQLGCELVVSYHPPIFSGLKRIVGPSPIFDALRNGTAIYSPHTALDVAAGGTNDLLAEILGIKDPQPLRLNDAKPGEYKLVTFVPEENLEPLAQALFNAGAGGIGRYSHCSFRAKGEGTFWGDESTNPAIGEKGKLTKTPEVRFETIVNARQLPAVLSAFYRAHPYEEPAIDLLQLAVPPAQVGQGRIGRLPNVERTELFAQIKRGLSLSNLLVSGPTTGKVSKAACLAGAGRQHLPDAIAQKAELYLTGEIPHHDALAAARAGMTVVATLHSNSERPILPKLSKRLTEKLPDLHVHVSQADRDPFIIYQ
ncbi:MAG TPA: Nif3-like dinuclear metal center hexameric protein [Tepidisphaeraceae bacterium]|nr:Nif3-like dinuclear metal center hexameric protein [Tepidisphaeraceae bacterium]